jgi:hypothetical protein
VSAAAAVRVAGVVWVAVAVGWTVYGGVRGPAAACAFGGVVVLGEALRVPPGADREGAPLATAGALGYALLGPGGADAAQTVTVTFAGAVLGTALRLHFPAGAAVAGFEPAPAFAFAAGPPPPPAHGRHAKPARTALPGRGEAGWGREVRRAAGVGLAALCCQLLRGETRLTGAVLAAGYIAVLCLVGLCDAVVAAALGPRSPVVGIRDELRGLAGMGSAVCAGGVVLAVAVGSAGLWAVPVVALPLLLTQFGLRGHAAVRATYRQTVSTLARATEVAGYTPEGHARRVGRLATAVGRELGLPARRLMLLEYAALMHDIGQLSLVDPVPRGATEPLDAGRREAIATLGGEVVRRTGAPAEVALIVEGQARPYREQPLAGRIVRAVNDYEDLTGESGGPDGRLAAVERLRLDTAHTYDPRVVEALTRVLAHLPTRAWLDARGDGKEVG